MGVAAEAPIPTLAELRGALGSRVRGTGSEDDLRRVMLGLMYLHRVESRGLAHRTNGAYAEPRALLNALARLLEAALTSRNLPRNIAAALSAIHPHSHEDIRRLIYVTSKFPPRQFEALVSQLGSAHGASAMSLVTPTTVSTLMARLIADECQSVYDPYSRTGELLTAAWLHHGGGISVHADSPRAETTAYTGMNLAVHSIDASVRQEHAPWMRRDRTAIADAVLCNPPFNAGGGFFDPQASGVEWPFGAPPGNSQNYAWLQHAVAALRPGGRAIVLMLPNSLWSPQSSERAIRARMIEARVVEGIIALPKNMFSSAAVAPVVWLLRPPGEAGEHVVFVVADHLGKRVGQRSELSAGELDQIVQAYRSGGEGDLSTVVPLSAIRDNQYSLSPGDYQRNVAEQAPKTTAAHFLSVARSQLTDHRREVDYAAACADSLALELREASSPDLSDGWRSLRLEDVCRIQAGPSSKFLPSAIRSAKGDVPVVMPKHLRQGRIAAENDERVSYSTAQDLSRFTLREGDLVCVRTGSLGKVALVAFEEEGWLLHTNLLRLRLRPDVQIHPEYLLMLLTTQSARDWIRDRAAVSSPVPSLATATLGELRLDFPPWSVQLNILEAVATLARQTAACEKQAATAAETQAKATEYLLRGELVIR